MAGVFVAAFEIIGIGLIDTLHEPFQIVLFEYLDQQMDMIGHQAIVEQENGRFGFVVLNQRLLPRVTM